MEVQQYHLSLIFLWELTWSLCTPYVCLGCVRAPFFEPFFEKMGAKAGRFSSLGAFVNLRHFNYGGLPGGEHII